MPLTGCEISQLTKTSKTPPHIEGAAALEEGGTSAKSSQGMSLGGKAQSTVHSQLQTTVFFQPVVQCVRKMMVVQAVQPPSWHVFWFSSRWPWHLVQPTSIVRCPKCGWTRTITQFKTLCDVVLGVKCVQFRPLRDAWWTTGQKIQYLCHILCCNIISYPVILSSNKCNVSTYVRATLWGDQLKGLASRGDLKSEYINPSR